MQRIFKRYLYFVMILAMLAVLLLNYQLQSRNAQVRMIDASHLKLQQLSETLANSKLELEMMTTSLSEDYLTRARAFAKMIAQNPALLHNQAELLRIQELLNVDELHVFNEKGILIAGTFPEYFGLDLHGSKQMEAFLPILDDPSKFLVQEIQPNGADGRLFQYVGVARQDQRGVVQVGLEPGQLLEAQKRNELSTIFSRLPVDSGCSVFAIDAQTGLILADTSAEMVGENVADMGLEPDYIKRYSRGGFHPIHDMRSYLLMEEHGSLVLGVAQREDSLYSTVWEQMFLILVYLLLTFMTLFLVLNQLIQKQIVDGLHRIMRALKHITDGNLKTVVNEESNPEFQQLSAGINQMVGSILAATVRISEIIELVDMPLGVFEFHTDMAQVMATSRLRRILSLTDSEAEVLYQDKAMFMRYLRGCMSEQEEEEIYQISHFPEKWIKIHMTSDVTGTFGIVTDVTPEMLEKRKIRHERDYDPLTGLCNRNLFHQLVSERLENPEELSVFAMLMLDLDRFKDVNDQYGHDWGDTYLKYTAQFLKEMCEAHSIVARRSGDEFCVFLYQFSSREELLAQITHFYEHLKQNPILFPDNTSRPLQISIGLAWYGIDLTDCETLTAAADIALYNAKNSGRGAYREYQPALECAEPPEIL